MGGELARLILPPLRLAAALLAGMLAAPPAMAAHDQLVIGLSTFPGSMHPDINPEQVKSYVLGFTMRPLSAFDAQWHNGCMICAELPSLQNGLVRVEDRPGGGQGMAVTVKLRHDFFWGDGVPVTTADLAFAAKVGHDPMSGYADTHIWGRIAAVDVIDAYTAVLHYSEIYAQFDRLPDLLPAHIEEAAYTPVAGTGHYAEQTVYNRAPTTPGLYDGPYLVTGYTSGESIVLTPNLHWAGPKPGFRRIVLKTIGDTAALQANLLSGDIDMAPGDAPALSIDQVLTLRRKYPDRFTYVFKPSLTYEHIDIDLDNPILADIRVRRALLLALDRQALVKTLFAGMQPVADGFVSPLDPVHAEGLPTYPYDPSRAASLLTEAGWTPGGDGIRRNARGERLSLRFGTTAGNRLRELQAEVLQSQWKKIGIDSVIRNEPARSFFGDTMSHRKFGGLAMYAWSSPVSYPPRQTLASDQVPTAANNWAGGNYMNFRNPTMDADIHVVETDLSPERQRAAWTEMQRIYADQLPALPLFNRADAYVLPKWLHGVTPTGHTDLSSEWAETWRAE